MDFLLQIFRLHLCHMRGKGGNRVFLSPWSCFPKAVRIEMILNLPFISTFSSPNFSRGGRVPTHSIKIICGWQSPHPVWRHWEASLRDGWYFFFYFFLYSCHLSFFLSKHVIFKGITTLCEQFRKRVLQTWNLNMLTNSF